MIRMRDVRLNLVLSEFPCPFLHRKPEVYVMKRVSLLLVIALCFLMAGCGSKAGGSYAVSGRITKIDDPQQGLEGVTIAFSGGHGTAMTDSSGNWSKTGLNGLVTITPAKEGWAFDPPSKQVTKAASNVDFVATYIPIQFEDPNLEAVVRETIRKPTGQLMDTDVARIFELNASNRKISSLGGIERLINLSVLDLGGNQISDISLLAGLTDIVLLWLNNNQISDISPLAGFTNLKQLFLTNNQISDISPLERLTDLQVLSLGGNQISDISPLAGLTDLWSLYLQDNQISDINPLSGLTGLKKLFLTNNQISDISPLAGLTNLRELRLYRNLIGDISALVANTGLGSGDSVSLEYNRLDLSPGSDDMQNINALIARGVRVYYDPQGPAPSSAIR